MIKRQTVAGVRVPPGQGAQLVSPIEVLVVPRGPLYVWGHTAPDTGDGGVGRWESWLTRNGVEVVGSRRGRDLLSFMEGTLVVVAELVGVSAGDVIGMNGATAVGLANVIHYNFEAWLWVFGDGFQGA